MKTRIIASCIVAGALMLPVAGYTADSPKTYVKDSVITTKVKSQLAAEKASSLVKIEVDTTDKGVVVLTGTAENQAAIDKAGAIAKAVKGVTKVENNVKVASDTSTRSVQTKADETARSAKIKADDSTKSVKTFIKDSVITTKVKSLLAADKVSSLLKIEVDTTATGVVVLTGTADNQAAIDKAVSITKSVKGVTSVESSIKVKAGEATQPVRTFVKDSVITTKIKSLLAAEKVSSLVKIEVDTTDKGVVVLTGTAANQTAIDRAVAIAKAVKGVTSVESNIKIKADK